MQSIPNFRDFGGYPTQNGVKIKSGLLYRSGTLYKASDADLDQLSALGIKTIIDLRSKREHERRPDRLPNNSQITVIHLPIQVKQHPDSGLTAQLFSFAFGKKRKLDFSAVIQTGYREFVTDFHLAFGHILKVTLNAENLPLLIHCSAGKDRTGLACCIIQQLLGMSYAQVLHDYLLSNELSRAYRSEMFRKLRLLALIGITQKRLQPLFEVREDYLGAAFEQIEKDHTTFENYVRNKLRFSPEDQVQLQELLLEPTEK